MRIWFSSDWHINHKNISCQKESSWKYSVSLQKIRLFTNR